MKNKKSILIFIIVFALLILIVMLTISIPKVIYQMKYTNKIDRILADDFEIEKKWIIDKNKIPYDLSNAETIKIEQTYINFSPEIRIRKIDNGKEYTFTVKTNITSDGMTREEMENNITEEEYNKLLQKKEGNTIYKTRYQFLEKNYLLAIDIFSGELEGLAYLEIEFENKEEANTFVTPDWVIKDVTSDLNYKNGYLARYGIPSSFFEYLK